MGFRAFESAGSSRPNQLTEQCWTQHDYLTIGPNKMSDRIARVAVEAANRERCYARTRVILNQNLPIARDWIRPLAASDLARATGGCHRAD